MKIKLSIRPRHIWVWGSVAALLITVSGCGAKAPKAFSDKDIENLKDAFTFEDQSPFSGIRGDVNLTLPESVSKFPTGTTHLSARLGNAPDSAEKLDGDIASDDFESGVVSSVPKGTLVDADSKLFLFLRSEKVTEASEKAISDAAAAGESEPAALVDSIYSGVETTVEDQIGFNNDSLSQLANAMGFEDTNPRAGISGAVSFNVPASFELPADVTHYIVKIGQNPSQSGEELTTVNEIQVSNFSDVLADISQVLSIQDGDAFHLYLKDADLSPDIGNVVYSGLSLDIADFIDETIPEEVIEETTTTTTTTDTTIGVVSSAYFEFNKYNLSAESEEQLSEYADGLSNKLDTYLTIAGHADERGTNEYNLALGERRALAVKSYLTALGIPGDNITTISYGEEQPVDAESNEAAWSKNRRAETTQSAAQ